MRGRIQPFHEILALPGGKARICPVVEVRDDSQEHTALKSGLMPIPLVQVEDRHQPCGPVGAIAIDLCADEIPTAIEVLLPAGDEIRQHAAGGDVSVGSAGRMCFEPARKARPGRILLLAQQAKARNQRLVDFDARMRTHGGPKRGRRREKENAEQLVDLYQKSRTPSWIARADFAEVCLEEIPYVPGWFRPWALKTLKTSASSRARADSEKKKFLNMTAF